MARGVDDAVRSAVGARYQVRVVEAGGRYGVLECIIGLQVVVGRSGVPSNERVPGMREGRLRYRRATPAGTPWVVGQEDDCLQTEVKQDRGWVCADGSEVRLKGMFVAQLLVLATLAPMPRPAGTTFALEAEPELSLKRLHPKQHGSALYRGYTTAAWANQTTSFTTRSE